MIEPTVFHGASGEYTLVESSPFATGRTSICFRARDLSNRLVCLKRFTQQPVFKGGSNANASFQSEIIARDTLKHPNILPIYDFGYVDQHSDIPFAVSPLCDHDLRTILRERQYVPLVDALPILSQVAQAIDFAHGRGVIHGDVKPENILFSAERTHVYLADFGTSRFFTFYEPVMTGIRGGSEAGGASAYLSPEQLGEDRQTHLSDIYSFSVVAYELLTGERPFDSSQPPYKQMQAKVEGRPRDPRTLNPSLGKSVAEALLSGIDVNPQKRPSTATELCQRLSYGLVQPPEEATSGSLRGQNDGVTRADKIIHWLKNNRLLSIFIAAGIVLVAIGTVAESISHIRDLFGH